MHADHHFPQLLLHATMVYSLCCGTYVCERERIQACRVELITKNSIFHSYFCTLSPDRLRHGAWVPEPLSIDCPDDEQVDSIGS